MAEAFVCEQNAERGTGTVQLAIALNEIARQIGLT
jgi:hypothetical protein